MPKAPETKILSERTQGDQPQDSSAVKAASGITPELVDHLADRIMSMLMQDLLVEKERLGRSTTRNPYGSY